MTCPGSQTVTVTVTHYYASHTCRDTWHGYVFSKDLIKQITASVVIIHIQRHSLLP